MPVMMPVLALCHDCLVEIEIIDQSHDCCPVCNGWCERW